MRTLANEVGRYKIRVNAVCPGMVRTDLWTPVAGPDPTPLYEATGAALPVGRVGEPDDIAATYLYLMGEAFSTGSVVLVDGGHLVA